MMTLRAKQKALSYLDATYWDHWSVVGRGKHYDVWFSHSWQDFQWEIKVNISSPGVSLSWIQGISSDLGVIVIG